MTKRLRTSNGPKRPAYDRETTEDDKNEIRELNFDIQGGSQPRVWDKLPWKRVEVEALPGFDNNAVFFGLEEIDGSKLSFFTGSKSKPMKSKTEKIPRPDEEKVDISNDIPQKLSKKQKRKRDDVKKVSSMIDSDHITKTEMVVAPPVASNAGETKKEKMKAKNSNPTTIKSNDNKKQKEYLPIPIEDGEWGSIHLRSILVSALQSLNFITPTPIQESSIPMTTSETSDIVGVAETGSGKTLAYALPIINEIISNWSTSYEKCPTPMALIIAPTRELVLQISTVINEVASACSDYCKIEVVTIIGGMSEHKQKRLLSNTLKRPVHIIVATPGRLHEMIFDNDDDLKIFNDMARLRYLVVDEVDRIMEEGHFNELHRIFSRIREHERLCDDGKSPIEELRKRQYGLSFEDDMKDNDHEEEDVDHEEHVEMLDEDRAILDDGDHDDDNNVEDDDIQDHYDNMHDAMDMIDNDGLTSYLPDYIPQFRQTLLFSATANQKQGNDRQQKGKRLKGIGDGPVRMLPRQLQELLSVVAVKKNTQVIDVTNSHVAATTDIASSTSSSSTSSTIGVTLPKSLVQYEVRVPAEDKDTFAYQFLLQATGRTLVFVNSIKTARRLDGLLKALDLNTRAIHAELQQKQRIKALESFQSSPNAILVATDVAARGLDIPKINTVLHYDIARTPQLYIHRSGRTARASSIGTALSLVTPEDLSSHEAICQTLGMKRLDVWRNPTTGARIDESILLERVKLAKKIFTQSFVLSQRSREDQWMRANAANTGLDLDEITEVDILHRIGESHKKKKKSIDDEDVIQQVALSKKELGRMRSELRHLLDTPIDYAAPRNFKNKPKFIVVAK